MELGRTALVATIAVQAAEVADASLEERRMASLRVDCAGGSGRFRGHARRQTRHAAQIDVYVERATV